MFIYLLLLFYYFKINIHCIDRKLYVETMRYIIDIRKLLKRKKKITQKSIRLIIKRKINVIQVIILLLKIQKLVSHI